MALRTRLLNTIAQLCRKYADHYTLAVLFTNQITTKVYKEYGQETSLLVPALGESWGHACTNRLFFYWKEGIRKAWLAKSSYLSEKTVSFCITVGFFYTKYIYYTKFKLWLIGKRYSRYSRNTYQQRHRK